MRIPEVTISISENDTTVVRIDGNYIKELHTGEIDPRASLATEAAMLQLLRIAYMHGADRAREEMREALGIRVTMNGLTTMQWVK